MSAALAVRACLRFPNALNGRTVELYELQGKKIAIRSFCRRRRRGASGAPIAVCVLQALRAARGPGLARGVSWGDSRAEGGV